MSAENDPNDQPQTVVGEHYRLVDKLGEGAFGEVYKAHHELLDQDFAVKLLKPELCEDEEVRARFLDEARALIRFSHPNVVQMRHVGEHEGRLFLVMDFVQGVELSDLMQKAGPLSEERALAIIKQLLSGLEAAHAAGIVHRDLKPSNILVQTKEDGTDHAKILDFGLSKFSAIDAPGGAHRSITGTIVGTLAYMSPEQIKGEKDIDGRSDLFAIGLILQEMLQGHHPYPGESGIVVAAKLLRDPIPPIDEDKRSKISHSTMSALGRALERDRDARFTSVTAFAQSLEGKGPPSDTSRVATILEAQEELARQEAEAAKTVEMPAQDGGKKKSPLPIVIVLLLVAGGAGWFLFGQDKGGDDPGTKTAKGGPAPKDEPKTEPKKVAPTPEPKRDDPEPPPTPKKDDPASEQPAPKKDDPATKEPSKDEPVEPPPAKDDPASKDPATKDPATKDAPTPPVEPKQDDPPQPAPAAVLPPEKAVERAGGLVVAGDWAGARKLFRMASVEGTTNEDVLTSTTQLKAMRGAAETWMHEADQVARTGRVDEALGLYQEAITWLGARHAAYERVPQAVERARLHLGFSRMYQGEAHVERARWLRLQGKSDETEIKKAEVAFEFALQQLDKDRENYWEFLVRRARLYALQRRRDKMMADLQHPTIKANESRALAHMWVAHATGARQVAQAWGDAKNSAEAEAWSRKAAKVAEDGVGWKDGNDADPLTRRQWLAMARVLFVRSLLQPASADPTPLHGKIAYWLSNAAKAKPAPWVDAQVAQARLLTGQAMERYLYGRRIGHGGKQAEAAKAYADGAAKIAEALRRWNEVAAKGGEKLGGLPHEVLAAIQTAQGKAAEAQASRTAAAQAYRGNPDA
ncbi:MAG: protein kinase [Planctomycetota bacterium]|nr:protein kinase [Planctomycetota bacterium]